MSGLLSVAGQNPKWISLFDLLTIHHFFIYEPTLHVHNQFSFHAWYFNTCYVNKQP